jgi:hypothetical protein
MCCSSECHISTSIRKMSRFHEPDLPVSRLKMLIKGYSVFSAAVRKCIYKNAEVAPQAEPALVSFHCCSAVVAQLLSMAAAPSAAADQSSHTDHKYARVSFSAPQL